MPDPQVNDTTPTIPASVSATPAPTATPETGTPASVSATPTAKQSNMSLEEALAKIANLEHQYANKDEEAKRHFKKLATYEEAERKAQEAALSDVEKANKRATEAEARLTQYKQQLITTQVRLSAQSKGIIDPELAALAIQNLLKKGDDGMPTNVDEALDALIKQKPYLAPKAATPAEPAAAATNGTTPPASPAQTAQPQHPAAPTIPAMNPGRSNIAAPTQLPPGRIPSLNDVYHRRS